LPATSDRICSDPPRQARNHGHCSPPTAGRRPEALRPLLANPGRPVVEALLDQRNLAGIGNLWAGETRLLRGVCPWTPIGQVELSGLVRLVRRMMHQAVGSCLQVVTTGDSRYGRTHWVYGRTHQLCRRCRTAIRLRSAISGEPY
jgi:endonuclease-8